MEKSVAAVQAAVLLGVWEAEVRAAEVRSAVVKAVEVCGGVVLLGAGAWEAVVWAVVWALVCAVVWAAVTRVATAMLAFGEVATAMVAAGKVVVAKETAAVVGVLVAEEATTATGARAEVARATGARAAVAAYSAFPTAPREDTKVVVARVRAVVAMVAKTEMAGMAEKVTEVGATAMVAVEKAVVATVTGMAETVTRVAWSVVERMTAVRVEVAVEMAVEARAPGGLTVARMGELRAVEVEGAGEGMQVAVRAKVRAVAPAGRAVAAAQTVGVVGAVERDEVHRVGSLGLKTVVEEAAVESRSSRLHMPR